MAIVTVTTHPQHISQMFLTNTLDAIVVGTVCHSEVLVTVMAARVLHTQEGVAGGTVVCNVFVACTLAARWFLLWCAVEQNEG